MKRFYSVALAAALAGVATVAGAADMPRPAPMPAAPKLVPMEVGSGWYLRGDTGYVAYTTPSVSFQNGAMLYEDLKNTFLVGLGVGYQYNNWLRADITVDYRFPSDFHGRFPCGGPCAPGLSNEYAKFSSVAGLVNGYVDLGNWSGFTPYVGAGVGFAYNMISDYNYVNPVGATPASDTLGDAGKMNFAWALMAGASYDFTRNMKLDAGYRYIHLGDAHTKVYGASRVRFKDINAHEVRIGLRYMFD